MENSHYFSDNIPVANPITDSYNTSSAVPTTVSAFSINYFDSEHPQLENSQFSTSIQVSPTKKKEDEFSLGSTRPSAPPPAPLHTVTHKIK